MGKEAKLDFWEDLAPELTETEELDEFEQIIHEGCLTLCEFKEYRSASAEVKFLVLGMRGPELTEIAEELALVDFNGLIKSFTYKCPTYDDTFRIMSINYLLEGCQLVLMLPGNQLFTHERARNTKTEAKILLEERFSGYYNQITFVTGLYSPAPDG